MYRILVIAGKMHSGGKKNLIMEYYRNIDRAKIQFDFVCDSDSNAIPQKEILNLGGKVYVVPPYQNIFLNMYKIYCICKNNDYEIIHSYNGTMNIFSLFMAYLAGVPIRINESISMGNSQEKKNILKIFLKPFSKLFSTHLMSNGVSCGIWQFGEKEFRNGNISIFKTIIDTEKNRYNLIERNKVRKKYNIDNKLVIGHIGRLTIQKNTLFVIDIFNEIAKINKNTVLLIIGDGDLRNQMLRKIKEYNLEGKVLYLGRREDIQQFYNAMDCFLLPSLYEGLPLVGVEAQCSGLPVFFSSQVPKETKICKNLCNFIDISLGAEYWANEILKNIKNIERKDCSSEVKNNGFDSTIEGKKLEEYYINLIQDLKCQKSIVKKIRRFK